jgi:HPt (histidine-containing phosphotransfer) domain-containing protein
LELPVLDTKAFERTAVHLAPEAVVAYLRTIAALGETLLRGLRAADAPTETGETLAEMAHRLAGSAGMFGFERLASTSRLYERSIEVGSPDREQLARDMIAALDASLEVMRMKLDMV